MNSAARILSVIFHPIFMPLFGIILVVNYDPLIRAFLPGNLQLYLFLAIGFLTVLAPGLSILFMKRNGMLSSLKMEDRKERTGPFILMLFYFLLAYYLMRKINLPTQLYSLFFGAMIVNAIVLISNFKFKISIHSAATWGIVGAFLALFQVHYFLNIYLLTTLILLAGLISAARIQLEDHTLHEVAAGGFLGGIVVYFCVLEGWFF